VERPAGRDLQDRVENYFLAWSNSVRRDLEALGVLEPSRSVIDALLSIAPGDMSNEQLEIAMALCKRQLALWDRAAAARLSRSRSRRRSRVNRPSAVRAVRAVNGPLSTYGGMTV